MYSTEQAARIVQIIGFLLGIFKIKIGIGDEELTQTIGAVIFAVATIYGWVRRYARGDLKFSGVRRLGGEIKEL